jgi:hypothetical protein
LIVATPTALLWSSKDGYRGNDVHVVRGASVKSTELKKYLEMSFDDGTHGVVPSDWAVSFATQVPSPASGTYLARYGFQVDITDGSVTVAASATDKVINNFIVIATAKKPGAADLTARIRVHIHDSRNKVKLSPSPLHLRQGTSLRLSVLVFFSDGVIGDVSYHPGITWQPTGPITIGADPHSQDDERQFKDGGFISATGAGSSATVKVTLPAYVGGATDPGDGEATIKILPGWAALPNLPGGKSAYEANWITGPGVAKRALDTVRNILFLPEGFLASEQSMFEELADIMAYELSSEPAFRPYDKLAKQFNFYRLWVPPFDDATRSGITELSELVTFVDGPGIRRGKRVPDPPDSVTTPLKSSEKKDHDKVVDLVGKLVYLVGLSVAGEPKATLTAQLAEWDRIYKPGYVTFDASVSAAVQQVAFIIWGKLAGRGLTVETDTVFGFATGGRPVIDSPPGYRFIFMHPLRYSREDINPLLSKITAKDSSGAQVALGDQLWVSGTSKDVNLVCFLTRGQRRVGTNQPSGKDLPPDPSDPDAPKVKRRHMAATFTDSTEPIYQESFEDLFPITKVEEEKTMRLGTGLIVPKEQVGVVAHEISHSLQIGDEYSSIQATIGTVGAKRIDGFWNLQAALEVDTTTPGSPIDVTKMRWLWPRITQAGFMKTPITLVSGDTYVVEMEQGHGDLLVKDDKVRARPARLLTRPTPGGPLKFVPPPALFQVQPRSKTERNKIVLKLISGAFDTSKSKVGDVLYKPALGPLDVDQLIMPDLILNNLRTVGPFTHTGTCTPTKGTDDDPQRPKHLPKTGLKYPKNKTSVVGLYDGGLNFRCGIYHATGDCIMRRSSWVDNEGKKTAKIVVAAFCHVCRYILVDAIDPRVHAIINDDYKPPVPK